MEGCIRSLARRYADSYNDGDFDDLCQVGRIAVNAIGTGGANNFNPKRATASFQAFVAYRVKFAMLDELRSNSGGVIRVPRQITSRNASRNLEDASRARAIISINDADTYCEPEDHKYDFDAIRHRREIAEIVHKIIDAMPSNWADVMRRRLKGEEFKEIGEAIGCSKSNAFQLSQKAHEWFAALVRKSYSLDKVTQGLR